MPKKKTPTYKNSASGPRAVNRKARRIKWTLNKKRLDGELWKNSMSSVPETYPLVKDGKDENGKQLYKRLG